jgi:HSP20 family protein
MCADRWRISRDTAPFRPIRELEEMRRRFDEDILRPAMHAVWDRIPEEAKSWSPGVDIFEKGDSLLIKAELPGMKLEDIDVAVTEETLTIKGDRKPEHNIRDEDYFRNELAYGNFYRSIDLPFTVDTRSVEAVYEDGILRISLQRAAGSKPHKIPVQVKKGARPEGKSAE